MTTSQPQSAAVFCAARSFSLRARGARACGREAGAFGVPACGAAAASAAGARCGIRERVGENQGSADGSIDADGDQGKEQVAQGGDIRLPAEGAETQVTPDAVEEQGRGCAAGHAAGDGGKGVVKAGRKEHPKENRN